MTLGSYGLNSTCLSRLVHGFVSLYEDSQALASVVDCGLVLEVKSMSSSFDLN